MFLLQFAGRTRQAGSLCVSRDVSSARYDYYNAVKFALREQGCFFSCEHERYIRTVRSA